MNEYKLNHINFKNFNGQTLITTDSGKYMFLSNDQFDKLITHRLSDEDISFHELLDKGMIYCQPKEHYVSEIAYDVRRIKEYLFRGTQLHIFVLTNRCNQQCIYCQASANQKQQDMSLDTARESVDVAMQSPSRYLTFEFQGGEPLLNFSTMKFIVNYANDINSKTYHKNINYCVTSNLLPLSREIINFFKDNKIAVSTSIDGAEHLQKINRPCVIPDYYNIIKEHISLLRDSEVDVQAIQTTTKFSLAFPEEIVDEYLSLGFKSIFIRPLTPIGLAKSNWKKIGYSAEEYIKFYFKALEYIFKLRSEGKQITESYLTMILKRILQGASLNYMELRSPCGGAIGQLAYNYDGQIFSCDEGRMLGEMGDNSFKVGDVSSTLYKEILNSPVTKTLCVSSCLEAIPYCESCVYQPFCGTCPIINYAQEGNIFSKMPQNFKCRVNMAIFEYIFNNLKDQNNATATLLKGLID